MEETWHKKKKQHRLGLATLLAMRRVSAYSNVSAVPLTGAVPGMSATSVALLRFEISTQCCRLLQAVRMFHDVGGKYC